MKSKLTPGLGSHCHQRCNDDDDYHDDDDNDYDYDDDDYHDHDEYNDNCQGGTTQSSVWVNLMAQAASGEIFRHHFCFDDDEEDGTG